MSWFDKVKSAVFVADPAAPPTQAAQAAPPAGGAATMTPRAQSVVSTVATTQPNEFVAVLQSAVKSRNTAFTSLLITADKMATIVPDPGMRLKAAFATIATDGRGANEVMAAIDIHMSDLEGQKLAFMSTLERKRSETLGQLDHDKAINIKQAKDAEQRIIALQAEIAQLQEVILVGNTAVTTIDAKMQEEASHFDTSKLRFEEAIAQVRADLENQRTAIRSSLSA